MKKRKSKKIIRKKKPSLKECVAAALRAKDDLDRASDALYDAFDDLKIALYAPRKKRALRAFGITEFLK